MKRRIHAWHIYVWYLHEAVYIHDTWSPGHRWSVYECIQVQGRGVSRKPQKRRATEQGGGRGGERGGARGGRGGGEGGDKKEGVREEKLGFLTSLPLIKIKVIIIINKQ
jgi:hypothetical protein